MSATNLQHLKAGDRVQYDSPSINGHSWIWQGYVSRVTWKFVYIVWTHSNSPVFANKPITEDPETPRGRTPRPFNRFNGDMHIKINSEQ